jgi:hypothetical protein
MKRAFSFGGGRQSTAALVLAAQGKIDVDLFVFANVGADSENPDTLDYLERWSKPYAAAHGIELIEVQRSFKDGRDALFLTARLKPLDIAVAEGADQPDMFDEQGACTSGHCWT